MAKTPRDFYEIQEAQRRKSLVLFAAVLLFHFVAIGLIALALVLVFGAFLGGAALWTSRFWAKFLFWDAAAAVIVAALHFLDARRNGARYILKRLQAATPDISDRYHKQFLDTVDEIRIASGLPRVNAYVLPSFAFNSLALIEADGTPAVAVTEGLLADGTRDELDAVAAHEIAHIARGDAFYLTMVCSLANAFEKLREALEPEREESRGFGTARSEAAAGAAPALLYLAVSFSALVMHLLSTLVSRERELLADAAAVELCRSPESLARAIYKAHVKNSFVGDFSQTYTPLFIVPPDARDIPDTLAGRLFNTHPPLMKRLAALAAMTHKSPQAVIRDVVSGEKTRAQARGVLYSYEETTKRQLALFPDASDHGSAPAPAAPPAGAGAAVPSSDDGRVWLLATSDPAVWDGPFTLGEMLGLPRFSLLMPVKNAQEGVTAKAREFPQVRAGLSNLARKRPIDPARQNLCPRCRVPLAETFYEGVPVRLCGKCGGKLVGMAVIDRIVARREVGFSEDLVARAHAFRDKVLLNPLKKQKLNDDPASDIPCPACGYRMVPRPYNYQYFIPVDKCLSCSRIWFDADELEILQVLIEERRS
jgi:Zn-dependent protease with chaperone function/Zn-finger nucleic acid-binding protein